jgi:hypothetical protein
MRWSKQPKTRVPKNRGRKPLYRPARGLDDGSRTDELGPVVPRTFDPAPGRSPTGHRFQVQLDNERVLEKTWVNGALRVRDGKELTRCAPSRNAVMLHCEAF